MPHPSPGALQTLKRPVKYSLFFFSSFLIVINGWNAVMPGGPRWLITCEAQGPEGNLFRLCRLEVISQPIIQFDFFSPPLLQARSQLFSPLNTDLIN